jgi:hypothetical protein
MNPDKPKQDITSWPPKQPVEQVDRAMLKRMSAEAIEQARQAGALDELLGRRKPEQPK